MGKRGASTIVRELELELERLQKRVDDVAMLVCTIGPKDPRSGPFIAKRVRELLGMKLVLEEPQEQSAEEIEMVNLIRAKVENWRERCRDIVTDIDRELADD